MTDIPLENPASAPTGNGFVIQMAIGLVLTALADWLFFSCYFGINVALYALCLCLATVLGIGVRQRGAFFLAVVVLVLAIAPAVEALDMLSFLFAAAGVVFFVHFVTLEYTSEPREWLRRTMRLAFGGPFHLCGDLRRYCVAVARSGSLAAVLARVSIWIFPTLLGAVFIWIFATANPVIEDVLRSFAFDPAVEGIDLQRIMLWILVLFFVWPFVRLRKRNLQQSASADLSPPPSASNESAARLIKIESILVSLAIFNLIFATQIALDMAYLWGGVTLPDGMTYSEYAHRGAYPLMWAALLSAAFVLVALRPGTSAERTPTVRILVFAWLGQNVLLVFFAAQRLNLYVDAYALTWSRVTALIWMWLVAVGLVLIVIRIARHQTNQWLIAANAIAVVLTFYIYSFVNVDVMIARYNITHSREVAGPSAGSGLDFRYLQTLGPRVIPELDAAIELPRIRAGVKEWTVARDGYASKPTAHRLSSLRSKLAGQYSGPTRNWRAWSFREYRLARYLATYEPNHYMQKRTNPHNF